MLLFIPGRLWSRVQSIPLKKGYRIVLQFFSSLFPPLPFLAAPEVGSSATFGTYVAAEGHRFRPHASVIVYEEVK